jgi:hypothetical protein
MVLNGVENEAQYKQRGWKEEEEKVDVVDLADECKKWTM